MGVMRMVLLLHTLLVIICINNIITKKNKLSKSLWALSGLCFFSLRYIRHHTDDLVFLHLFLIRRL